MNRSQCLIWSRPRAPPCPWEMRKDLQNRGPLLFSVPGMVRKAALAFSERLCNLMLLSGLTRRHLLALDPSAKFNFRSSQGPPSSSGAQDPRGRNSRTLPEANNGSQLFPAASCHGSNVGWGSPHCRSRRRGRLHRGASRPGRRTGQ